MYQDPRVLTPPVPYEYREFPKWVEGPEGPVLVQNAIQELDVKVSRTDQHSAPPKVVQENIDLANQLAEAQKAMQAMQEELAKLKVASAQPTLPLISPSVAAPVAKK